MGIKNLLKRLTNNLPTANSTPPKPRRMITVQTSYGSVEIVNLKRIWVCEYLGTYRLMYTDETYEYNTIYWTNTKNHNYHELKDEILEAYNNGDAFIEL